ncbi:MAG TPA: MerR family transcriptional regulator [Rhodospirillaceae bacterium]|nr:MerR family transcriptional regulator [Rhodospirillaceae bacterium]
MNAEAAQNLYDDRIAVGRIRKRRQPKAPGAFLTIGEVADQLQLEQHVLRFWESKFPQIQPVKRAGSRRYYRPDDVALLKRIKALLYRDGYTIRGVQQMLDGENTTPPNLEIKPKTHDASHKLAVVTAVNSTLEATQQMLELDEPETVENAAETAPAKQFPRQELEKLMTQLLEIRQLVSQQ